MNKIMLNIAKYSPLYLILAAILLIGCNTKRPAIGNEDEIIVIADSSEYYELEGQLIDVFGKVIYTPQPENLFEITWKKFSDLEKLKRKKNIIILAPLNSGSDVSKYVTGILDSNVLSLAESGEEFVFNKYNMWAEDQLVMILTSPSADELKYNILNDQENLIHYFRKISNKRLFQSLYNAKYEKLDIEAKLLNDYGWIIYVQADFLLAKDVPEDNFVWLRRAVNTDMERWIFVHWIENASPELLNKDSIVAIRDRITSKHYRTRGDDAFVEIAKEPFEPAVSEVNFLDKYSLMSQGFWRFSDKSGGGPFLSYTFFDENSGRIYMLDGSIYAPKYYKKKLIQQVDVTLQSFITKDDLAQEKIDILMDELD